VFFVWFLEVVSVTACVCVVVACVNANMFEHVYVLVIAWNIRYGSSIHIQIPSTSSHHHHTTLPAKITLKIHMMGPKISSWAMLALSGTSASTVGG